MLIQNSLGLQASPGDVAPSSLKKATASFSNLSGHIDKERELDQITLSTAPERRELLLQDLALAGTPSP